MVLDVYMCFSVMVCRIGGGTSEELRAVDVLQDGLLRAVTADYCGLL